MTTTSIFRGVVTREATAFENNDSVSPDDFWQAHGEGEFAVHWEAYGHCYALPCTINDDIRANRTVVANVSRTVIEAMRRAYANAVVVSITAPAQVLAERLESRRRSSDGQLTERLVRKVDAVASASDVTIINVGSAEHHAHELVRIIRRG